MLSNKFSNEDLWKGKEMNNIKALTVLLIILFVPSIGFSEVRKEYYESGALKKEVTFKNGKKEGLAKKYYESGVLRLSILYKNGKPEGFYTIYDESGAMKQEFPYFSSSP
jgi:antitoxin component YwqK of YwqJK toxin-antitoxin module